MLKPTSRIVTETFLDYSECAAYVEHKLGYSLRDTLNSSAHYENWCKLVGEACETWRSSQYARYKQHPEGEAKQQEYRDWWHFLIDNREISNPCVITIGSDLLDEDNDWQNEITKAFIEEFGDDAKYRVSW